MKKKIIFLFLVGSSVISLNAQSAHTYLRRGDSDYEKQEFAKAEEDYRKALEKDKGAQGTYNLGNTIYEQKRYDEAINRYEAAANNAKADALKARAYHNLGNAYFNKKEYEKSIEAYKDALRLSPSDMDTKINLAKAQQILQQQQQQQNKQQQQEKQPQDNQKQQPPDSPKQDPQQQQDQSQQPQQPEEGKDLSKEEARKLLEIINQEEQKVQEKLRKAQAKPTKSKKDW